MTVILVAGAIYVGLIVLVLALVRAAAGRDRDERAWLDRQGHPAQDRVQDLGSTRVRGGLGTDGPATRGPGSGGPRPSGPRTLMVVRHPSSGLRPVVVDVTPRGPAGSQAEASDPA
jgi:hypothetical protein